MAAGGSLEPFWALYAQHKTKEVLEILETLRIGNIDPEEVKKASVKVNICAIINRVLMVGVHISSFFKLKKSKTS